ncbi:hypothetical protein DY000_02039829 [Brassica cretica]|uniref:Uncharacterized protein n=1 Tax=Brassica cretica TaxID=69181 RepID=A0ABQ7BK58_BRACR|nr:hypothetical protein DY000_02039829 [Brassica cretica]
MPLRSRLSREEKGKDIADSPSPTRDASATGSPLDDFDLIHRDALRDTENMTLSQRLLVADAHRMIRDEGADRVEVGSSDVSGIRHPSTIAYPEKFFESAQTIAAHSHLRWPDLSREWIRRQQARIARGALLKGKLQMLLQKSTTVDPQGLSNSGVNVTSEGGGTSREGGSKEGASKEEGPIAIDQGGGAETSASGPKKKKKSKKTKGEATDEAPPKESASLDATSEGSKAKKKKDGRKRSRGGAASSADRGEGLAERQEAVLVGAAPDGHPKKRTKRSIEAEPRPSTSDSNAADATLVDDVGEASGTPENLSEERRKTSSREGGSGGEPERSAPDSYARKRSGSEGSVSREIDRREATLEGLPGVGGYS